jgi:hypothetical protein
MSIACRRICCRAYALLFSWNPLKPLPGPDRPVPDAYSKWGSISSIRFAVPTVDVTLFRALCWVYRKEE